MGPQGSAQSLVQGRYLGEVFWVADRWQNEHHLGWQTSASIHHIPTPTVAAGSLSWARLLGLLWGVLRRAELLSVFLKGGNIRFWVPGTQRHGRQRWLHVGAWFCIPKQPPTDTCDLEHHFPFWGLNSCLTQVC